MAGPRDSGSKPAVSVVRCRFSQSSGRNLPWLGLNDPVLAAPGSNPGPCADRASSVVARRRLTGELVDIAGAVWLGRRMAVTP